MNLQAKNSQIIEPWVKLWVQLQPFQIQPAKLMRTNLHGTPLQPAFGAAGLACHSSLNQVWSTMGFSSLLCTARRRCGSGTIAIEGLQGPCVLASASHRSTKCLFPGVRRVSRRALRALGRPYRGEALRSAEMIPHGHAACSQPPSFQKPGDARNTAYALVGPYCLLHNSRQADGLQTLTFMPPGAQTPAKPELIGHARQKL